jgi:hypothetical protein
MHPRKGAIHDVLMRCALSLCLSVSLSLWFGESMCFLIELMFYPASFTLCEESMQWFFQGSFIAYVMLQRHSTPVAVDFCMVRMISSRELCSICNASVPFHFYCCGFVSGQWQQSLLIQFHANFRWVGSWIFPGAAVSCWQSTSAVEPAI